MDNARALEMPCGKPYFSSMDSFSTRASALRQTRLPALAGAAFAMTLLLQAPAAFAACGGQVLTSYNESPVALAQRCGTTVQDLRLANPGLNLNKPLTGVQVDIPSNKPKKYIPDAIDRGAPPASSVLGPIPHSHNPIRPSNYQRSVDAAPYDATAYTIRGGDTLGRIASRAGVSLQSLMAANPGVDPRRLQVGGSLSIPIE